MLCAEVLVMIEAMACGTPVIAFRCGSVPEIVEDGVTGFVVEPDAGLSAIERVGSLDRRSVRTRFEQRFTARRMAEEYVRIYEKPIQESAVDAPNKDQSGASKTGLGTRSVRSRPVIPKPRA